ncbi:UDP-N-acetylmuramoyl-tripeptide--D-alanyl-D-alanine ligase [Verrucomicrobiaceae bacterium N1E253]|uniref:UDP-N-acetylmuramoyl-tripeptide--D-alanyl-D-alanine ligase n=1 Tax=Oceaniferula marina TaxID=2748318 RepID=A0A851GFJ0_9BACT|nr:UDP-N-acetylmuramoyl-tripeptide--D-alanyl-D-alanine ligase [Oceaniferula marina]NWK56293.1 UDP-N-acetylmuramoyl-tripeptide--D-alanyl-D-alanine ligase [Oceaniferula marina]
MKPLTIEEIRSATGGELVGEDTGVMVHEVSTDSRHLTQGALFIALRGDNFDGHAFLQAAVDAGAACLLVDHLPEGWDSAALPCIVVGDTLNGLQRLAYWYRRQLDIRVVGITGSNGKTSVKDFTASVLSQQFRVNATKGNLNNHIGLPLSVLSADEADQVCVWEMGMNHSGEIAPLCEICAPEFGIITNIGTAHIEFLGSRQGIAEEKSALARALPDQGTLIVTASCDYVDYLIERTHSKVIVAGNCRGAVRAEKLRLTDSGSAFDLSIDGEDSVPVEIGVCGKHMVNNALLAAAAGHALGMSAETIARGLNACVLTSGRLRRYESAGVSVIDDTYNANPDSVIAAIETLSELPVDEKSRRIVVLGMMAELGVHADREHRRVGELAAEKGLQVVSVGKAAMQINLGAKEVSQTSQHFDERDDAAQWLKEYTQSGDCVLFKGSRMAGMEQVMHQAFPQEQSIPQAS